MILGDIKSYIKQRGEASLSDVAIHFDISESSAEMALNYWIKKGIIQPTDSSCGSSCNGCGTSSQSYRLTQTTSPVKWFTNKQ